MTAGLRSLSSSTHSLSLKTIPCLRILLCIRLQLSSTMVTLVIRIHARIFQRGKANTYCYRRQTRKIDNWRWICWYQGKEGKNRDWWLGPRFSSYPIVLIADPNKHRVARRVANVWAEAMEAMAEELREHFPNDEERTEFAQAVNVDMKTSSYHLYCNMYVTNRKSLIHRYLVIGRKPAENLKWAAVDGIYIPVS